VNLRRLFYGWFWVGFGMEDAWLVLLGRDLD